MTIRELYEYAKAKNILDYNIEIQNDGGGYYSGTREIEEPIDIEDDLKLIVV